MSTQPTTPQEDREDPVLFASIAPEDQGKITATARNRITVALNAWTSGIEVEAVRNPDGTLNLQVSLTPGRFLYERNPSALRRPLAQVRVDTNNRETITRIPQPQEAQAEPAPGYWIIDEFGNEREVQADSPRDALDAWLKAYEEPPSPIRTVSVQVHTRDCGGACLPTTGRLGPRCTAGTYPVPRRQTS